MAYKSREQVVMAEAHHSEPEKELMIGCINPRALGEAILGRPIEEDNMKQDFAEAFGRPYEELFDMKYDSPLYAGLQLGADERVVRIDPEKMTVLEGKDLSTPNLATIRTLQDLTAVGVDSLNDFPVRQATLNQGILSLDLNVPALRKVVTNQAVTKPMMDIAIGPVQSKSRSSEGWTPPNCYWRDVGDFQRDVTEGDDPIQGAVGDCWLIAALAAVAWVKPYVIVHRTRSVGPTDSHHVSKIEFFSKGGSNDAPTGPVEVKDAVIVNPINRIVYAKSRDLAELWPSLYEKAFAKWATKDDSDMPRITSLRGGDPVKALAQLMDGRPRYYLSKHNSVDQLFGFIRRNSAAITAGHAGKTLIPMVAWTYPSGSMYVGSNVVANHAYTILGYTKRLGNREYILLRNPWGYKEPVGSDTLQEVVYMKELSWWRRTVLPENDGIFALEKHAFHQYFAGLGVATSE